MAMLQELDHPAIREVLETAAQRRVPLTVTIRADKRWINLRSRLLAADGRHVLIESPISQAGEPPHAFALADRVGLSFKLKHHKHIFSGPVADITAVAVDGIDLPALRICTPMRMQRLQRRVYERVEVPAGRIVRASCWLGGRESEPAGGNVQMPVWTGRVSDISAGGFQMVIDPDGGPALEVGDAVGVRLSFGAAEERYYADAQFRHVESADGKTIMGFQFVGLDQTVEGRLSLRMISSKVSEFQHGGQHVFSRG